MRVKSGGVGGGDGEGGKEREGQRPEPRRERMENPGSSVLNRQLSGATKSTWKRFCATGYLTTDESERSWLFITLNVPSRVSTA